MVTDRTYGSKVPSPPTSWFQTRQCGCEDNESKLGVRLVEVVPNLLGLFSTVLRFLFLVTVVALNQFNESVMTTSHYCINAHRLSYIIGHSAEAIPMTSSPTSLLWYYPPSSFEFTANVVVTARDCVVR